MQKSNQLWWAVVTAAMFFMTPVAAVYGQSQKEISKTAADADRTDSTDDGTAVRPRTSEPSSGPQDESVRAKHTDPLNSSPQATNPETYRRDMEQRFPVTNDPAADNPARSRDVGS